MLSRLSPVLISMLVASSLPASDAGARIAVAVSVAPQAYIVERVGGRRVSVQVMIPPGVAPPGYAPGPRQLASLSDSHLYVLVGHPAFVFEAVHMRPFLDRHPEIRTVRMFETSGGVDPVGDPHVWLDPRLVQRAARDIARALGAVQRQYETEFRGNLRDFLDEVEALDLEIQQRFEGLPRRRLLVAHPAWGHFAHHYGLEQVAIESEGKEPVARQLIPLIERERRAGTHIVFVQPGFPRKSAELIAREIGGELVEVDPLAGEWLSNMRHVSVAFARALADG